ncbi:MAG TPA: VWA domain-containing protein, partial [Chitinophagales bacterium]|nr:VWA domain-containing protein [Chitinophagales bacterium]
MKRVLIFNFLTLCQKCVAFAFAILFFACKDIHAQPTQVYKPNVNRVLFVLDISGSMAEKWGERARYEIAKDLLYRL